MKEYQWILDEYAKEGYEMYSRTVPRPEWGRRDIAEEYLSKYWLPEAEYQAIWKPLQAKIFVQERRLPDLIFHESFQLLAFRGGCLFDTDDFARLQKCILAVGDRNFVVVQNTLPGDERRFRFKFPSNITWTELLKGNFVSSILFEMPHNEYFVFGDQGGWGKYVDNDYEMPVDLVAYKPEHRGLFCEAWKGFVGGGEIYQWLPPAYQHRVQREKSW